MSDVGRSSWAGRLLWRLLIVLVVVGLGVGLTWGYLQGRTERAIEAERELPIKAPQRVSLINGEPVITLDPATQRNSGIATVTLSKAPHQAQVQAYGMVIDLQQLTDLSNSYANSKAQLGTVQAKLNASRAEYERSQKLYENRQLISAAQLQSAEAAFRVDEANLAAAQSLVQTLAATAQQTWGAVLGRAVVDSAPMLSSLVERREILIQVTLAPGASVSQPPMTALVQSDNGLRTNARFVSLAPKTDPRIQGVSFLYIAPAVSGFIPGMNVLAFLSSGSMVAAANVPASAIIWWQGRAWMYVRTSPETFVRREIATDAPGLAGEYVVKGLRDNTEVVTQGAQMLLSEEFRAQVQVGEEAEK
jgi:hypothetical protein